LLVLDVIIFIFYSQRVGAIKSPSQRDKEIKR